MNQHQMLARFATEASFDCFLLAGRAGAKFDYQDADAALIARAQRLDALCRTQGIELKAAAIQFTLAHPAVSGVLLGARSAAEVEENVAMARRTVPAGVWSDIRRAHLVDPRAPVPGDAA